jgi:hypothetical protein
MRKMIPTDSHTAFNFKYATSDDFLKAYDYSFLDLEEAEIVKLFFTANWMSLLFATLDPRGNKGLAMSIIPKLIEGFSVKYSTGGGQSAPTAARVRIYEHEGSVKPHERPTRRSISITLPMSRGKKGSTSKDDNAILTAAKLLHPPSFKRIFSTDCIEEEEGKRSSPVKRVSIGPGTFTVSTRAPFASYGSFSSESSYTSLSAFSPRSSFIPSLGSFSSSSPSSFTGSHLRFFGQAHLN